MRKDRPNIYWWAQSPQLPYSIGESLTILHDAHVGRHWLDRGTVPDGLPAAAALNEHRALKHIRDLEGEHAATRGLIELSVDKDGTPLEGLWGADARLAFAQHMIERAIAGVEGTLGWVEWPWTELGEETPAMGPATRLRARLRDNEGNPSKFWIGTAPTAVRAEATKGHVERRREDLHRDDPGEALAIEGITHITDWTLEMLIELNGAGLLNAAHNER